MSTLSEIKKEKDKLDQEKIEKNIKDIVDDFLDGLFDPRDSWCDALIDCGVTIQGRIITFPNGKQYTVGLYSTEVNL